MEVRDLRLVAPFTGGLSTSIASPFVFDFVDADPVRGSPGLAKPRVPGFGATWEVVERVRGGNEADVTRPSHLLSVSCARRVQLEMHLPRPNRDRGTSSSESELMVA